MDRLRKKVKDIHEKTGQKVVIITHSMGGLVTKSFLALYKDEFAAHVDTWIAIAAPFRGRSPIQPVKNQHFVFCIGTTRLSQ